MCRSGGVAITTPVDKMEPPTDYVIPSERSEPRNLLKWQVLSCGGTFLPRGGFLRSACATVGMTQWGDVFTNSPTVSRMFQAAPLPHQSGLRPASFPGGEAFVPGFGVPVFIGNGSVLSRAERHIGRSLRFRWWAVVFNRGALRTGGALFIVGTTGAKGKRPSTKIVNCQLPIVNWQRTAARPSGCGTLFVCIFKNFNE